MFIEKLKAESQHLEQEISSLKAQIKSAPRGTLLCAKDRNSSKWYIRDDDQLHYLPKKQRPLAEALAIKKYQCALLDDFTIEKRAIGAYLAFHQSHPSKSSSLLSPTSTYHDLLSPYFQSFSAQIDEWREAPYDHNPNHPEQLIYKTFTGNTVRSKSETIIDSALYLNHIPYRYECALRLGSVIFYPDFTILHPTTGNVIYWEHFGMMDDIDYARNAYSKLHSFSKHGIIPSINLIVTYETRSNPLTSDIVDKTIQLYLK